MDIQKLREIIDSSDNIVLVGQEYLQQVNSDFRSADGLYSEKTNTHYSPEEMLFMTSLFHTKEFFNFYRSKMIYRDANQMMPILHWPN